MLARVSSDLGVSCRGLCGGARMWGSGAWTQAYVSIAISACSVTAGFNGCLAAEVTCTGDVEDMPRHRPLISTLRLRARLVSPGLPMPRPSLADTGRCWTPERGIVFAASAASHRQMSSSSTAQAAEEQDGKISTPQDSFQAFGAAMRTAIEQANEPEPRRNVSPSPTRDATTARGAWPPDALRNVPLDEPTLSSGPESSADGPPHSPLRYTISPALRAKAQSYPPLHPSSYWTHTLYRGPPPHNPKVIVHYCRSLATADKVCQLFLPSSTEPPPVLGFDIEWRPSASSRSPLRHNVSVVQLASEARIAVLHLALFSGPDSPAALVPPTLKHILESPAIRKVGVAIKSDCTRLRTHLGIDARAIFELSHLYRLVQYASTPAKINKRLVALQTQVEELLALPLYKGEDVRASDWSRELAMHQVEYAAADSYAGLVLWDVLERKRRALRPCPPLPWNTELNLPIRLAGGEEVVAEKAPAAVDECQTAQLT